MKSIRFMFAAVFAVVVVAGCASVPSKREALAELKAKGVAFDEASFVKAAKEGDIATVKLFVEAGMSPRVVVVEEEKNGELDISVLKGMPKRPDISTPLLEALLERRRDVVDYLLAHGAVDDAAHRFTAIAVAALLGDAKTMRAVLDIQKNDPLEIDLNAPSGKFDQTILMLACGAEKESLLLGGEYKYDDPELKEVFNPEVVKLLLDAGADVRPRDTRGMDALYYACLFGRKDIADILMDAGADIKEVPVVAAPESAGKIVGVPIIVAAASSGNLDLVKELVGRGADVNVAGSYFLGSLPFCFKWVGKNPGTGVTALHAACHVKNKDMVEYLLSKGADVNAKKPNGDTPLVDACSSPGWLAMGPLETPEPLDLVKLLVEHGADVENNGALGEAASMGYAKIVAYLLAKGAPMNRRDRNGRTPLMLAGRGKHKKLYKLLLEKGADPSVKDKDGKTADSYLKEPGFGMGALVMPALYGARSESKAEGKKKDAKSDGKAGKPVSPLKVLPQSP